MDEAELERVFEALPIRARQRYVATHYLGQGSYGRVYRALQRSERQESGGESAPVALKILRPELLPQDPHHDVPAEVLSEFATCGFLRAQRPQDVSRLVRVEDIELDGRAGLIAFELMHSDLRRFVKSRALFKAHYGNMAPPLPTPSPPPPPLSPPPSAAAEAEEAEPFTLLSATQQLVLLALDVARGLQQLHALECVHLDLKPENVLVRCEQQTDDAGSRCARAKLADFSATERPQDLARRNQRRTTPAYRAPELLAHSARYGRAADLWAYALVLVYLFFGLEPLAAPSLPALREKTNVWEALTALVGRPSASWCETHCAPHKRWMAASENSAPHTDADADADTPAQLATRMLSADAHCWALERYGARAFASLWELVFWCLRPEPAQRPAAADVLAHPCFALLVQLDALPPADLQGLFAPGVRAAPAPVASLVCKPPYAVWIFERLRRLAVDALAEDEREARRTREGSAGAAADAREEADVALPPRALLLEVLARMGGLLAARFQNAAPLDLNTARAEVARDLQTVYPRFAAAHLLELELCCARALRWSLAAVPDDARRERPGDARWLQHIAQVLRDAGVHAPQPCEPPPPLEEREEREERDPGKAALPDYLRALDLTEAMRERFLHALVGQARGSRPVSMTELLHTVSLTDGYLSALAASKTEADAEAAHPQARAVCVAFVALHVVQKTQRGGRASATVDGARQRVLKLVAQPELFPLKLFLDCEERMRAWMRERDARTLAHHLELCLCVPWLPLWAVPATHLQALALALGCVHDYALLTRFAPRVLAAGVTWLAAHRWLSPPPLQSLDAETRACVERVLARVENLPPEAHYGYPVRYGELCAYQAALVQD